MSFHDGFRAAAPGHALDVTAVYQDEVRAAVTVVRKTSGSRASLGHNRLLESFFLPQQESTNGIVAGDWGREVKMPLILKRSELETKRYFAAAASFSFARPARRISSIA
jgi:hypothetical protein